jgi:hypothetical protein
VAQDGWGRRDPGRRRSSAWGEEGLGVEVRGRSDCGFEEGCVGGDGCGHGRVDSSLLSLGGKGVAEREAPRGERAGANLDGGLIDATPRRLGATELMTRRRSDHGATADLEVLQYLAVACGPRFAAGRVAKTRDVRTQKK